LPIDIVGVTTVREADGLAMSSRNRFLSAEERMKAPALIGVLRAKAEQLAMGRDASEPLRDAVRRLAAEGFDVDYIALVDGTTLVPINRTAPGARLIAAAKLGRVRLIDNVGVG